MPTKKVSARALRQLAEEVIGRLVEEGVFLEAERADVTTSLVRQWISYEGNATFFLGGEQVNFVLGRTPLGKPYPIPEPASPGWIKRLTDDWKIDPDDLPDIFSQLNRAQSAEATNSEGTPLRLWVNPLERSRGVEPLVKEKVPADWKRDHRKIAAGILEERLGDLDPEEIEALACSVARQWQKYQNVASVFVGRGQLFLAIEEFGEGNCRVDAWWDGSDIERQLAVLGFAAEVIPEVVVRLNLCQEIEFQDKHGTPSLLGYDPKAKRLLARPVNQPAPLRASSPFCPRCTAVLKPWRADQQQTCPNCGQIVWPL